MDKKWRLRNFYPHCLKVDRRAANRDKSTEAVVVTASSLRRARRSPSTDNRYSGASQPNENIWANNETEKADDEPSGGTAGLLDRVAALQGSGAAVWCVRRSGPTSGGNWGAASRWRERW